MGDYVITAPDGRKFRISGQGTAEQALGALRKMLSGGAPDDMRQRIEAAKAGTLEPSRDALDRAAQADQIAQDRATLAGQPGLLTKAAQGIPFVGEYSDELTGLVGRGLERMGAVAPGTGERAMEAQRAVQDAMQRERPGASMAAMIGGGIVGGLPMAGIAAPAVGAMKGGTLLSNVLRGAAAGGIVGGVEGAVSGFGSGEGGAGKRVLPAVERGLIGAGVGGAVGAAAPALGAGARSLWQRFKGRDVSVIAREMGISDDAARVVKRALENDDLDAAEAALRRGGASSMLADAGPSTQGLLDAAVATGGKGGTVARRAIDQRAIAEAKRMDGVLNRVLGKPEGVKELARGVRDATEAARATTYDAAYSARINYEGTSGRTLESMLKRVPASAWNRANALMRLEGNESRQILADIAADGTVTLRQMPDVRQIDYLTRALNDVAAEADGAGKLGGTTDLGRATSGLSRSIRQTLRGLVPEYGKALDTAADAISRKQAIDLGAQALRPSTTREMVREATKGMSLAEQKAAKQGLRSYIDETLANARGALGRDSEISEALKLVRDMSSRGAREKMVLLLGPRDAGRLAKELDQVAASLETRASIAANSRTAIRQTIREGVQDVTAPGMVGTLAQGQPANAAQRVVQALTGQTPEAMALRQQGIFDQIAESLTRIQGPEAQRALATIRRAMDGQPVTDAEARAVAAVVSRAAALGGYPLGVQAIERQRQ